MDIREFQLFLCECDYEIVFVYDSIQEFLFPDLDFYKIVGSVSPWVIEAGISPESPIKGDTYNELRKSCKSKIINRLLHWYDMEVLLSSLQDRIVAVQYFCEEFYKRLEHFKLTKPPVKSNSTSFLMGEDSMFLYAMANSAFVSVASALDILAKIAYEISKFSIDYAESYKKMLSRDILYKHNLDIADEMCGDATVFTETPEIRIIETIRNEYVHNSSWAYRTAIYCTVDGEGNIVDAFVPFPDVLDGYFVKVAGRNHFYSEMTRLNDVMLKMLATVIKRIVVTAKRINDYCENKKGDVDHATKKQNTVNAIAEIKVDISENMKVLTKDR